MESKLNVGQRIGNLLLKNLFKKGRRSYYNCLCDCGKLIEVRADSLLRPNSNKSCGCSGAPSGPKRKPNEIEIFLDHAEIIVSTKGRILKVLIDKEMIPTLGKFRWHYSSRYICTRFKCQTLSIQYFILPRKEGFIIDHINRDPLDNRLCNLRYATTQQNSWNRSSKERNFKGVYFNKNIKRWIALVTIGGKKVLIDSFLTKEEGLKAYDFIVKINRGDFSVTNLELDPIFLTEWKNKILLCIDKEQEKINTLKERVNQINSVLNLPVPTSLAG
jgi:hypothetical protein